MVEIRKEKLQDLPIGNREGSFGTVYLYEKDDKKYAVKIFNQNGLTRYGKKLKRLLYNINLESYCFPIDMIEIDGEPCGYIMDFIPGIRFLNYTYANDDNITTLRDLIMMYKKLRNDTITLSNIGIKTRDIVPRNMIISDSRICVIDTDEYKKRRLLGYEYLYKKTMKQINLAMIDLIYKLYPNLYRYYNWRIDPISREPDLTEFLEKVVRIIEDDIGQVGLTLCEIQKIGNIKTIGRLNK